MKLMKRKTNYSDEKDLNLTTVSVHLYNLARAKKM